MTEVVCRTFARIRASVFLKGRDEKTRDKNAIDHPAIRLERFLHHGLLPEKIEGMEENDR